jgi:hypothetical protein
MAPLEASMVVRRARSVDRTTSTARVWSPSIDLELVQGASWDTSASSPSTARQTWRWRSPSPTPGSITASDGRCSSNPAIVGLLRSVERPLWVGTDVDGDLQAVIDLGHSLPAAA